MTRTLEQEVAQALKAWDDKDVLQEEFFERMFRAMEAMRAALTEREKRLPYQVILENGLAKIEQQLIEIKNKPCTCQTKPPLYYRPTTVNPIGPNSDPIIFKTTWEVDLK